MYELVTIAAMLAFAGCGSPNARTSGVPTRVEPTSAAAPTCELAGDYRLRDIATSYENVLWFRFHVSDDATGATGELASETAHLFGAVPALVVTADRKACTVAVRARHPDGTDSLTFALEVNPKTGGVEGKSTLTQPLADNSSRALSVFGARDIGAPKSPAPCFVPGIYMVDFDPQTSGCLDEPQAMLVRVEPLVDGIEIQLVESEPPYGWVGGSQTSVRHGCDVALTLNALIHGYELEAKLTFTPDKITGTATKLQAPGAHGNGGTWGGRKDCTSTNAKVSGVRIAR